MSQRTPSAEAALTTGARRIMLCTVELPDGRFLRVATEPIEVATAANNTGEPYAYDPWLSGITEFVEEVDVFNLEGTGALTQARIELVTPGVVLAELQAEWAHLSASTVEIAYIWPGEVWEDRVVLLAGTTQSLEMGVEGEAVTFSVEASPPATSATIGDDTRDLGDDWPAPLLDSLGATMTDLAGKKGVYVYGVVNSIPGYKIGIVAGSNRLVLANHHLVRTGGTYQVEVYQDGTSVGLFTVTNGTTAGGDPYAYTTHATEFQADDGAYTWKSTYGGLPAANGADRPALTAEGVVRRLLADSGLAIDWRRSEAALQRLRSWSLGIYIDQEAPAISVLRDRILKHLPVVELTSGTGLWLAWAEPHIAPIEGHLTVGQEILGRVGRMTTTDLDAVRNTFTINYDRELSSGDYRGSVTVDADTNTLCYLSKQLLQSARRGDTGVRADEPIDCDACQDEATARRIGNARASRLALPRRIVEYELAADAYWLGGASVVMVTDPGFGLSKTRAVVTSISKVGAHTAVFETVDRTWMTREPA